MKKNFVFNSVRYDDIEGILCVELELKKTEKRDVFSASGSFLSKGGKSQCAGQILDEDFIFANEKDKNLFLSDTLLDILKKHEIDYCFSFRADGFH